VTWVVPLALGGFAILTMAVFTMLTARKRHRATVAPAAVVGPRILIHDINDDRCTGCDACVAVCPTNVLDLVSNKSRVLRFQDCIQCEACMFACPTEALVMFPEGGTPPVLQVPEIDENFQTAVPGQYLIGEVAGKPLVKNAANLGRAVIEHMLAGGMQSGAMSGGERQVDVAIIGSGPGGLSAALTCIQRGLSYVVLEKEQMIASTISRYPKGKLVMAEPYDVENLSFLPVFDAGKEQLLPIWGELIERVGVKIQQGESVETVARGGDGVFDIKTTVAAYRAQRVVLSIGTRGKPRTLQVPGENLPKVYSLLEDPDEWRGKSVLIVGGGDSACEAALALADAGAKVMISYRGKGFNRAQPKNKQAIEGYAGQGRIKAKLGSQVLSFEADSVTLQLADGAQKRYPNDAAFVLIGADPPIQWLEKMGVRFVERPHQYQLGKTDEIVRRFVARGVACPEDAARAAAQVLGGSVGVEPASAAAAALPMPMGEPVSGPRKWLRSATSIFSHRTGSNSGNSGIFSAQGRSEGRSRSKKFDVPVPLSEFAKRNRASSSQQLHTGHGRRDALSAGERTRILRMLRDEGGRIADEESQVLAGPAPGHRQFDFDFDDDSPAPAPAPSAPPIRADIPAKPAVVVGIAQAQAARYQQKRTSDRAAQPPPPPRSRVMDAEPPPPPSRSRMMDAEPPPPPSRSRMMNAEPPPPSRSRTMNAEPPPPSRPITSEPPPPPRSRTLSAVAPPPQLRRPVPVPFSDEPTRQVDDALLNALRTAPPAKPSPRPHGRPGMVHKAAPDDPTGMADIGALGLDDRDHPDNAARRSDEFPPRFLGKDDVDPDGLHSRDPNEATRLARVDSLAAIDRARGGPTNEERTRAVNIRNDPSISDIDWDID
jgi:thioredoxin reductase (NADPH)